MNELCVFSNLTGSDWAAWTQAGVGSVAMIVGTVAVIWQVRRNRMEISEREARAHDGLARLLIHLKDYAVEARSEKRKLGRWPAGHPAEPSSRFKELADAIQSYPLDAIQAEVPFDALLNARRAAREMWPLVGPEPELDVNADFENTFQQYVGLLEEQILQLRAEAERLYRGEPARHAAALEMTGSAREK